MKEGTVRGYVHVTVLSLTRFLGGLSRGGQNLSKKNYKRNPTTSFVPRFDDKCQKEDEEAQIEKAGKREYYSKIARANRVGNEKCTDKGLNRKEMEIVRRHRKSVKERTEELRAELELKRVEDWF